NGLITFSSVGSLVGRDYSVLIRAIYSLLPGEASPGFYSCVLTSSMTLPSLGRLPAGTNVTSQRRLQTARTLSTIDRASASLLLPATSHCSVMRSCFFGS